jgi:hypothetical protein
MVFFQSQIQPPSKMYVADPSWIHFANSARSSTMTQQRRKKWMAISWMPVLRIAALAVGGTVLTAGGCLPPNFYSTLLSDTIITGVASAVLDSVLATAGM